jgi:hypothetical protein
MLFQQRPTHKSPTKLDLSRFDISPLKRFAAWCRTRLYFRLSHLAWISKQRPKSELWSAAKVCRVANVMRRARSRASWVIRFQKSIPASGIRHTLELRSRRKHYPVPNRESKTNTINPAFLPTRSIKRRNYRSPTGDKKVSKWFCTRRSFAFSVGFERTKLLILMSDPRHR